MTKTEERKLLNTVARHRFQDELRHLQTRQGRFDAAMLHLDHPLPGTGLYLTPSDHGAGAESVRDEVEAKVDGKKSTPFWLRLWRRRRLALDPCRRTILDALAVDWRSRPAARIAEVSQPTVDAAKKIFKTHFAQCHTAWKRDFAS